MNDESNSPNCKYFVKWPQTGTCKKGWPDGWNIPEPNEWRIQ